MKSIKALIFGATGMVGKAVLLECLEDERISEVTCVVRNTLDIVHPKLRLLICKDFNNLSELSNEINGYDVCFYTIGIPSSGWSEEKYNRITFDYTIKAVKMLLVNNSDLTFCYVSAQGADSSERSIRMWARVRGKTENALMSYPFKHINCFRPGYIQPMKGVKSQVKNYRIFYALSSPFYGLIKHFPSFACTSVELAKEMLNAAYFGYSSPILESREIVKVSKLNK
ncbi:MAG: epimerase [Cyclobacteriaceae bacterium]|nr:epimerase [Cyclobacteriaceae bacterium]